MSTLSPYNPSLAPTGRATRSNTLAPTPAPAPAATPAPGPFPPQLTAKVVFELAIVNGSRAFTDEGSFAGPEPFFHDSTILVWSDGVRLPISSTNHVNTLDTVAKDLDEIISESDSFSEPTQAQLQRVTQRGGLRKDPWQGLVVDSASRHVRPFLPSVLFTAAEHAVWLRAEVKATQMMAKAAMEAGVPEPWTWEALKERRQRPSDPLHWPGDWRIDLVDRLHRYTQTKLKNIDSKIGRGLNQS